MPVCLSVSVFSSSLFSATVESLTLRNTVAAEENEEKEEKETFVAFARVYSGVVKKGQRLFVLGPKYDPAQFLRMVNGFTEALLKYQQEEQEVFCFLVTFSQI